MEKMTDRTIEVRERQIQNNQQILEINRKQLAQLSKRAEFIENFDKKEFDHEIENIRNKIQKLRSKIKELKKKQKLLGNSIVNSEQVFQEMKKLQIECDSHNKKKFKLQSKIQNVQQGIVNVLNKISSINQNYFKAEQFFNKQAKNKYDIQGLKKIEYELRYKKEILEVTKKKHHSQLQIKQQKYHTVLKQYQNEIERGKRTVSTINQVEMKIIHTKHNLTLLEECLKNLNNQREVIRTTSRVRKQEISFFAELQNKNKNPIKELDKSSYEKKELRLDFSKIKGKQILEQSKKQGTIMLKEDVIQPKDDKNVKVQNKNQGYKKTDELDWYLKQSKAIEIEAKKIDIEQFNIIYDQNSQELNKPNENQEMEHQKREDYEKVFMNQISDIQEKLTEKQPFSIDLGDVTQKINSLGAIKNNRFEFDDDQQ